MSPQLSDVHHQKPLKHVLNSRLIQERERKREREREREREGEREREKGRERERERERESERDRKKEPKRQKEMRGEEEECVITSSATKSVSSLRLRMASVVRLPGGGSTSLVARCEER